MSYILHLLPLFYPIFTLQIRIRIHKAPQYGSGSTTLSVYLTFVPPPPHAGGGRGLAVQLWQPADQRRTQQQDQDHHQADHRHGTGTYIYSIYTIHTVYSTQAQCCGSIYIEFGSGP